MVANYAGLVLGNSNLKVRKAYGSGSDLDAVANQSRGHVEKSIGDIK